MRGKLAVSVGATVLALTIPFMVMAQRPARLDADLVLTKIPEGTQMMSGNQPWYLDCPAQTTFVDGCTPEIRAFMLEHGQAASAVIETATGLKAGAFYPSVAKGFESRPSMGLLTRGDPYELAAYLLEGRGVLNPGTLTFYRDYAVRRDAAREMWDTASLASPAADEYLATVAHEVFHGYQVASPGRFGKVKALLWIGEGTAEAVGTAYVKAARGRTVHEPETVYDEDLRDPEYAYRRGHFFYSLGKVLDGEAKPVAYLGRLFANPVDAKSDGIGWMDSFLAKETVGGLRGGFGEVVARYATAPSYFSATASLTLSRQDPPITSKLTLKPFVAEALTVTLNADLMRKNAEAGDTPGRTLTQVEIKLSPESSDQSLGLAVERNWLDRKPFTEYLAQNGQPGFDYFVRATNVAKTAITTKEAKGELVVSSRQVVLEGPPGCMKPGETATLALPTDLKIGATLGRLTHTSYTAPTREGEAVLKVTARLNKTQTTELPFAKVKVTKAQCGMRITMESGRIWYDALSDASQSIDDTGEITGFWDKRGVFALDEERGWMLTRWATIDALAAPAMRGMKYSSLLAVMPPGAAPGQFPHRVAPNIIAGLERSRAALEQAMKSGMAEAAGSVAKSNGPCLHGGGTCTIWTIGTPGEDGGARLYYNAQGQIRAVENFGSDGTHVMRVDYGYFPVAVPVPSVVM